MLFENKSGGQGDRLFRRHSEVLLSPDLLLAQAYQRKGEMHKSIGFLQSYTYYNVMRLIDSLHSLMVCYTDNLEKVEECYQKGLKLCDIFEIKSLYPIVSVSAYLIAEQVFSMQNQINLALDALGNYVNVVCDTNLYPLQLQGNGFFDSG